MGLTSASWIAVSTQNGVMTPVTSAGSNHRGESVRYSAHRISPSGLAWAEASSARPPASRITSTKTV